MTAPAGPDPAPDALAGMRARVDEAYSAADRLVREAEATARRVAGDVPRNGWAAGARAGGPASPDLAPLLTLLEGIRQAVPPELAQRLAEAVRELLVALRALLDWWIERLDAADEPPPEVEDIPIR